MRVALLCFVGALVGASSARAQPEPEPLTAIAVKYDPTTCKPPEVDTKAKPKADSDQVKSIPISLTDFEITGELVDPAATVRALLAPTIQAHNVLSEDLRIHARDAAAAIGYHLVGLGTRDTPDGKHAVLALQPMPMIRKAEVDIDQRFLSVFDTPLFEESVKRRIQLRPGTYLPWDPLQSACEMTREQRRIEEYLQSEGYFDASAIVVPKREGNRITIVIRVKLGSAYKLPIDDKHIIIVNSARLPVAANEIREAFRSKRCVIRQFLCISARFTKLTHTAGIEKVTELFHRSQYPGVRVNSTKLDWDRASHTIKFVLTIEPRRKVDVDFRGIKPVSDDVLARQLTFNKAQSADDVEAEASARAIAAYLQTRGFFEARVTWYRDSYRNQNLDLVVFQIDAGASRTVRQVTFKGSLGLTADRRKAEAQLLDAIATKPIGTTAKLLGAKATATSADLTADVGRLLNLYKRIGYRDARVTVSAATTPIALGSAALTGALLAADRNNDIYVQFAIEAGLPTLLTQVSVALGATDEIKTPEQLELCREVLKDLAVLHKAPSLAQPVNNVRCIGTVVNQTFREGDLAPNRDALKQLLFERARPRADVEVEWKLGEPRRAHIRYVIKNPQQLKVGKIVLRGNFRTRDSIIRNELLQANFREGQPLTSGALAEATRRLRNTGLFETTNVQLLDIDKTTAGSLNIVVEVTERYDYPLGLEANVGYSSFNGVFVSLLPSIKNWFGTGISLDTQATVGFDPSDAVDGNLTFKQLSFDATLRIPQWISRRWHIPLQPLIEINGFIRRQDTPRFGILRTTGFTTTLSRSRSFPRTETAAAHAVTGGFNYSYRLRARNVDALRPIGADDDDTQVPIDTTTGSVGAFLEWEHRNDRSGQLSPLAPEAGFRLEGQVSVAHPFLSAYFGQDTFVKVSGAGSKYWPLGTNLVLRVDGRYDHGFPLGGAALLPEVERYFGGGDSTIRGYEDDRLTTELIEVAVPPLDNITQIRVLPAGGNIRAMFSADAQLRIYKLFSTALFFDAGLITNQWSTVTADDLRPALGMALIRIVTPFGAFAWERAVPLRPRLGDDPRGRWHVSFAARAQF
jgi:outer membrane protein assembly factor BamA